MNLNLVDELSRRFDIRLIAPEGAASHAPGVSTLHVSLRPLSRFLVLAGWQAIWQACAWKPNIVLAGSGLTAPLALLAARICGAQSIAYVHGLDLVISHPIYRLLWRPALRRLDNIIANSSPTAQLARDIGIAPERITIVHPGVSIPDTIDPAAGTRFRQAHGLGAGAILLAVGRLTARKGLREFVSDVLPIVVASQPNVQLVVVGDEPTDALYAEGQSIQSIQAAARVAGVEGHIHFLGKRFGQELADAYMAADVHVFPVRHNSSDPEGFGMVALEAAAHGLPTVAYATGGVVDAVKEEVSGRLVRPGDVSAFAQAVIELLGQSWNEEVPRAFARQFAWAEFGAQVAAVAAGPIYQDRSGQQP